MPTKIRLARHGRRNYAFYSIVVADSRAPRDGRYIEKIGTYNPNTNPATIDLKFERALHWLQVGAQPTNTARNILSYEGVMMKKHLLEGVKKGAFDEETADRKFDAWISDKRAKIQAKKDKLSKIADTDATKRLEAEVATNKERVAAQEEKQAAELKAKKEAEEAARAEAEKAQATEETEEATEEVTEDKETPEAEA